MSFTTVLGLGEAILGLLNVFDPESKELKENQKFIEKGKRLNSLMSANSVTAHAQKSIIRPMVGIEQSLIHAEFGNDLMTVIQLRDMIAVLTHLERMGTVDGVNIGKMIDSVATNRGGLASFAGCESFGGVDMFGSRDGMEAVNPKADPNDKERVIIGDKSYPELREYVPLAVGRTVRAQVQLGSVKTEFPLTFRQIPMPMSGQEVENVFDAAKIEDGLMVRIDMHTVGLLTTPQLLTGSDIINNKFKIRMRDMKGYYGQAQARVKNNQRQAIATGVVSMNSMANTFIMTNATARKIEAKIARRFSNAGQREDIFKRVMANTIVVVNEGYGTFEFYTMGDPMVETYTRNEIKTKAGKESAVSSLQDLMKLVNGGN